jgi:diacylglycerol kinase family enzyme
MNAAIFGEAHRIDEGEYDGLISVIRVILRFRPRRMRITLDDGPLETRALMVAIANGPYTGLGLMFAPDARLDDGLFDVRLYRRFSRYEAVRHILSIAAGRRPYHPRVTTHRSRQVVVESRHPLPCRADAQDLGTTPVTFLVRPAALRVIVPA